VAAVFCSSDRWRNAAAFDAPVAHPETKEHRKSGNRDKKNAFLAFCIDQRMEARPFTTIKNVWNQLIASLTIRLYSVISLKLKWIRF